jgi:hypothetical protein
MVLAGDGQFRRRQLDRQTEEEMRFHLDLEIAKGMERGLPRGGKRSGRRA